MGVALGDGVDKRGRGFDRGWTREGGGTGDEVGVEVLPVELVREEAQHLPPPAPPSAPPDPAPPPITPWQHVQPRPRIRPSHSHTRVGRPRRRAAGGGWG